jgi:PleD family two-component response regulator
MYSILIICPQIHSREATAQHIAMTLPKSAERQITTLGSVEEAQSLIGGRSPTRFTHIVLNLPLAEAINGVIEQVETYDGGETTILILSDSVQRQEVQRLINSDDDKHANDVVGHKKKKKKPIFVLKPVKPSRFAVIFDPLKVSDASIDRNRTLAQQVVDGQKASYVEIEKHVRGMGYRVLLVEDNMVNQRVMKQYLTRIGVEVDMASDGEECVGAVLSKRHDYYSLILVRDC